MVWRVTKRQADRVPRRPSVGVECAWPGAGWAEACGTPTEGVLQTSSSRSSKPRAGRRPTRPSGNARIESHSGPTRRRRRCCPGGVHHQTKPLRSLGGQARSIRAGTCRSRQRCFPGDGKQRPSTLRPAVWTGRKQRARPQPEVVSSSNQSAAVPAQVDERSSRCRRRWRRR